MLRGPRGGSASPARGDAATRSERCSRLRHRRRAARRGDRGLRPSVAITPSEPRRPAGRSDDPPGQRARRPAGRTSPSAADDQHQRPAVRGDPAPARARRTKRAEQPLQRQARRRTRSAPPGPRRRRRPGRPGAAARRACRRCPTRRRAAARPGRARQVGGARDGERRDQQQHRERRGRSRPAARRGGAAARAKTEPARHSSASTGSTIATAFSSARRAAPGPAPPTGTAPCGRRRSAGSRSRSGPARAPATRPDAVDGRREVEIDRVVVELEPARAPAGEQFDDARVRAPVGLDPEILEALASA